MTELGLGGRQAAPADDLRTRHGLWLESYEPGATWREAGAQTDCFVGAFGDVAYGCESARSGGGIQAACVFGRLIRDGLIAFPQRLTVIEFVCWPCVQSAYQVYTCPSGLRILAQRFCTDLIDLSQPSGSDRDCGTKPGISEKVHDGLAATGRTENSGL